VIRLGKAGSREEELKKNGGLASHKKITIDAVKLWKTPRPDLP
jgi:hypothetical protein